MRLRIHSGNGRLVVVFMGFIFAILLSLATILILNTETDAKDSSYIYKSIRIEDGDTLEGIAGRFLSDSGMPCHSDFVREISRVNRLSSDKIISGAYLVIPVLDNCGTPTSL